MKCEKIDMLPGVYAETIGECWIKSVLQVVNHGKRHHDGDVEMLEILGLNIEISDLLISTQN